MATIRYHLDEHIPLAIAEALRRRGIDVSTTQDVGLIGATDEAQLAYCRDQCRVLVTSDADMLRLHGQGVEHAGIAYLTAASGSLGDVIRALEFIWQVLEAEDMRNRVEYL